MAIRSALAMAVQSAVPLDRVLNISGDSRTANCHSGAAPNEISEAYGYGCWIGRYSGGRVRVSAARNGGVGGDTTAMWLARMPTILANGGSVFVNLIGTNDRGAANLSLDNYEHVGLINEVLQEAWNALTRSYPYSDPVTGVLNNRRLLRPTESGLEFRLMREELACLEPDGEALAESAHCLADHAAHLELDSAEALAQGLAAAIVRAQASHGFDHPEVREALEAALAELDTMADFLLVAQPLPEATDILEILAQV